MLILAEVKGCKISWKKLVAKSLDEAVGFCDIQKAQGGSVFSKAVWTPASPGSQRSAPLYERGDTRRGPSGAGRHLNSFFL